MAPLGSSVRTDSPGQGDGIAFGTWESANALAGASPKVAEWVSGNLPDFNQTTERFNGEVGTHAHVARQSVGQGQSR